MNPQPEFLTTLTAARQPSTIEPGQLAWVLVYPLVFRSLLIGVVTVPATFETDFASVPRLPWVFALFGDQAHAAAVVHDYLCRVDYPECRISWTMAARVFYEAMRASQVPRWRAWAMYTAVRFAPRSRLAPCTRANGAPNRG